MKNYNKILEDYEIDSSKIVLEITESASIKSKYTLLENVNKFKEMGFEFALDDFGSGESNLNYVLDMPASIVKFDKDMIQRFIDHYVTDIIPKDITLSFETSTYNNNVSLINNHKEFKNRYFIR